MKELLIKNGLVATYIYEGYHSIKQRQADIYIVDGEIREVSPGIKKDCEILDAEGCLVLPGMVNMGSSTFASKMMNGILYDTKHCNKRIRPLLDLAGEILTDEEISAIASAALWDTLRSGVTTVVELCRDVLGTESNVSSYSFDGALPKKLLVGVRNSTKILPIHLLFAQRRDDGSLWIEDLHKEIVEENKAIPLSAITCAHTGTPYTNWQHVKKISRMAINTGIFDNNMLNEMRMVALSLKQDKKIASAYNSSDVYKSSDAFYSATVVGGRILDRHKYGRIGPGFYGDLSVVSMNRFAPLSYPISQYVYGADSNDVRHVICRGNVCKRDFAPDASFAESLHQAQEISCSAIEKLWAEARRRIL